MPLYRSKLSLVTRPIGVAVFVVFTFMAVNARAEQPTRCIVVASNSLSGAEMAETARTLESHLVGTDVHVVFRNVETRSTPTRSEFVEMAAAQQDARRETMAVLWIDPGGIANDDDSPRQVVIYEPRRRSIDVRRLTGSASAHESYEEVGIIARSTVASLLVQSREPGFQNAAPDSDKKPAPNVPAGGKQASSRGVRLQAAYVGTTYAPTVPWTSGLGVSASIRFSRAYVGAEYGFFPTVTTNVGPTPLQLTRHDPAVFGGYEFGSDSLGMATEVATVSEATVRGSEGLRAAETHWSFGLSARAHLFARPVPAWTNLRIFAAVGATLFATQHPYSPDLPAHSEVPPGGPPAQPTLTSQELFSPSLFRISATSGVAVTF